MLSTLFRRAVICLLTASTSLGVCLAHAEPDGAAEPDETRSTATAYARPLTGIKLDGDLTDWPEDIPWYPLLTEYGVYGPTDVSTKNLLDNDDMTASFSVGYDAEAQVLIVAVVVRDDVHVVGSSYNNTDALELYVDGAPTHGESGVAQRVRSCIQYAFVAGNGSYEGNGKNITTLWADPIAASARMGYKRDDDKHTTTYEVSVPAFISIGGQGEMSQKAKLAAGTRMWLDLAIADFDNDGIAPALVFWGPIAAMKYSSPEMFGDVVLLGPGDKLHTVKGVAVQPDGKPLSNVQLALRTGSLPAGEVMTDAQGRFTFPLPAGSYELSTSRIAGAHASEPLKFTVGNDGPEGDLRFEGSRVTVPEVLQRAIDRYTKARAYNDETRVTFSSNMPGGGEVTHRFTFTTKYEPAGKLEIIADNGTIVTSDGKELSISSQGRPMAQPVKLDGPVTILDLTRAWGAYPNMQQPLSFQNGHRTNGELPLGGAIGGLFVHKLFFEPEKALHHVQSIDVIGKATLNRKAMTMVQIVQPAADVFPGLPFGGFRRGVSTSLLLWIDDEGVIHQTRIRFDMAEIYAESVAGRQSMPIFLLTAQHNDVSFDNMPQGDKE